MKKKVLILLLSIIPLFLFVSCKKNTEDSIEFDENLHQSRIEYITELKNYVEDKLNNNFYSDYDESYISMVLDYGLNCIRYGEDIDKFHIYTAAMIEKIEATIPQQLKIEYESYSLKEAYEIGYIPKATLVEIASMFNNNIHKNCKNKYIPFLVNSYQKEKDLSQEVEVVVHSLYYESKGNLVVDISHEEATMTAPSVYYIDDIAFYLTSGKNLPTFWKQTKVTDCATYPMNKMELYSSGLQKLVDPIPWTMTSMEILKTMILHCILQYQYPNPRYHDLTLEDIKKVEYYGLHEDYYHLFYVEFEYQTKLEKYWVHGYYEE